MAESIDCAVIGAGVVGLAVARALALAGREVVVLEAAGAVGTQTSSRNSEVIHAGIYYPSGSLKARLCVEGRERLYRFCAERGVPHRRLGKLIVATRDSEVETLERYRANALANGVQDLEWLDVRGVARLEPAVRCVAALHSPSTGILDSHAYMQALQGEAEHHGAVIALRNPVRSGRVLPSGIGLEVESGGEAVTLTCRAVVNCAGLTAPRVARSIEGMPLERVPRECYAKGHYFVLKGRSPFDRLIYPVPEPGGLGVHVTLDLGGQARFGPDVEWVDAIDYGFDASRARRFFEAIRRYYPALPEDALLPGYTGIRPKIAGPGEPAADFLIQGPETHGVPGLVHLFGIESPGLTASLAIAERVAAAIAQ
ncbi:NAD(P)/FAD-dependent oxidoreductase [Pelomicrobium sp. G1]|uniref:NAD(P)/FAD-dependent oxidoreductase n=1 Tax=unclassified Pelomicrobium TaxID=2815318 RepID=UPI003F774F6C